MWLCAKSWCDVIAIFLELIDQIDNFRLLKPSINFENSDGNWKIYNDVFYNSINPRRPEVQ